MACKVVVVVVAGSNNPDGVRNVVDESWYGLVCKEHRVLGEHCMEGSKRLVTVLVVSLMMNEMNV